MPDLLWEKLVSRMLFEVKYGKNEDQRTQLSGNTDLPEKAQGAGTGSMKCTPIHDSKNVPQKVQREMTPITFIRNLTVFLTEALFF